MPRRHARPPVLAGFSPAPGFDGVPLAPPQSEPVPFPHRKRCKTFMGPYLECGMEWDEWKMVEALVTPHNTVLELGARYSTTSCVLCRATNNSGFVLSVEPDAAIWRHTESNRRSHNCNFALLKGVVSHAGPLVVDYHHGYATSTRRALPNESSTVVPHFDLSAAQARMGRKFDTLLIDCEGCIGTLLPANDTAALAILSSISLLLLEHDNPERVALDGGYSRFFALFRRAGLEQIWYTRDTYAPTQAWSRKLRHSAWRRGGLRGTGVAAAGPLPSCFEHARRMAYGVKQLNCLPVAGRD